MNYNMAKYFRFVPVFILAMLAFAGPLGAQDQQLKIIKAITAGDAKELVKHFHQAVSLSLPGTDGVYNRIQAENHLQKFFNDNKTLAFKINHQGQSREGSRFLIGKMSTATRKYNVYYLMKEIEGTEWIIQFQIETSEE